MIRTAIIVPAIALLAALGTASAQPPPQQTPAVSAEKPSTAPPTVSQQQQHEQMLNTRSGMGGKEEPSSHAPSSNAGTVGVATAPEKQDSQTTSSKYSERNAALDKLPIMAQPLPLNEAQKQLIYRSVSETRPAPDADAVEPAHALPSSVVLHPLPKKVVQEIPALGNLHYARFANKVLLVRAPNRIVVGVIEK